MVLEGADAASRILRRLITCVSVSVSVFVCRSPFHTLPFPLPPSLSLSLSLCAFLASYVLGKGGAVGGGVRPGEHPRPLSVVKQVQ